MSRAIFVLKKMVQKGMAKDCERCAGSWQNTPNIQQKNKSKKKEAAQSGALAYSSKANQSK